MAKRIPNAAEKAVAERLRQEGKTRAAEIVEQGKGASGHMQRQIQKAAEKEGVDTGWAR